MTPWLIHSLIFLSSSWLGSHIWSCVSGLKETSCMGRCRATRFPVWIHLLLLLCWIGARMTSIHCMCVIPRRCRSCGTMSLRRCCCTGVVAPWHRGAVAPCSCGAGLHSLYDYMTLRSASVVFIDNVRAGTFSRSRSSQVWILSLFRYCLTT
jgi:hypothetical protein